MKTAKIVSTGPLGTGTKVLVEGVEVPSVVSIKIGEIKADELLTATVTLAAEVDLTAVELLVDEDTLKRSAEAQGFELYKSFPLIMEPMEFVEVPDVFHTHEAEAEEESPLTAALRFMADYVEEQEATQQTDLAALVARAEKERPHDTLINDLIAGMRELAERHNRLADQLESPLKKRMQERLRERAVAAEAEVARLTAERDAAEKRIGVVWKERSDFERRCDTLRAKVARLTAERDAAQPVAWRLQREGWETIFTEEANENVSSPERYGYTVTPLYAHPAPDTLRQVREAISNATRDADEVTAVISAGKRVPRGMTESLRDHIRKLSSALALLPKE